MRRKLLTISLTLIMFSISNIAFAETKLIASTEDRTQWQLWNRYNNQYYFEYPDDKYYTQPDSGIRFKFNQAGQSENYDSAIYGLEASDDNSVMFNGAYLVSSMKSFGLSEDANLMNKTLSVKVRLKIDGKNPVFVYPADEANSRMRLKIIVRIQ